MRRTFDSHCIPKHIRLPRDGWGGTWYSVLRVPPALKRPTRACCNVYRHNARIRIASEPRRMYSPHCTMLEYEFPLSNNNTLWARDVRLWFPRDLDRFLKRSPVRALFRLPRTHFSTPRLEILDLHSPSMLQCSHKKQRNFMEGASGKIVRRSAINSR